MKRFLAAACTVLCISLSFSETVSADMFGGDIVVLTQILAQAIAQLAQLKQILQSGNDTLGFLQDVNRGINDSLNLAKTLGIRVDPGLYRDLRGVDDATRAVEDIFGRPVDSPLQPGKFQDCCRMDLT